MTALLLLVVLILFWVLKGICRLWPESTVCQVYLEMYQHWGKIDKVLED